MSLHLPRSNTLFLHVPKCGGTWVEAALKEGGVPAYRCKPLIGVSDEHAALRHFDLTQYENILCFVRSPITWYESWFRFSRRDWKVWTHLVHPQDALSDCGASNFADFVLNVQRKCSGYVTDLYSQYTRGKYKTNSLYIGRTEHLADELIDCLTMLREQADKDAIARLKPVNASKGASVVWPCDLLADVKQSEAQGIKFWETGSWTQTQSKNDVN